MSPSALVKRFKASQDDGPGLPIEVRIWNAMTGDQMVQVAKEADVFKLKTDLKILRACYAYVKKHLDRYKNVKIASKSIDDGYFAKYSRLFLAMSRDQAKAVLGLPPGANPSKDEVLKVYRQKAIQNHPDRGGDTDKMVEINVAKDTLLGEGTANPSGRPQPVNQQPVYRREPPKNVEPDFTMEGQTFEEAWAKNTPPAGGEWKFVSIPEWYWEKSYYPGHRIWTMYGQTDSKHVICAVKERGESAGTIPTDKGQRTKVMEDWQVSWITIPLSKDVFGTILPKALKSVGTAWDDGAAPSGPKKYILWPGGRPIESIFKKVPRSGGSPLKAILVGAGLIGGEEGIMPKGHKSTVEMYFKYNLAKRNLRKEQGGRVTLPNLYDFYIRVNGKEALLSDETAEKLNKGPFLFGALNNNVVEGKTTNITKLKGGMLKMTAGEALQVLSESLGSEPSWLQTAIKRAAEEYKDTIRTASVVARYKRLAASPDVSTVSKASDYLRGELKSLFGKAHIEVIGERGLSVFVAGMSEEEYVKEQIKSSYKASPNVPVKIVVAPSLGNSAWDPSKAVLKAVPTGDVSDLKAIGVSPLRKAFDLTPEKAVEYVTKWFKKNRVSLQKAWDMSREVVASSLKEAIIVKEKGEYCVKSPNNKDWNGGCYPSEEKAKERLKQVEYFKHNKAAVHKVMLRSI